MLRLVLFDVDGTLVDSQAHIYAALTATFEAQGMAVPTRAHALAGVGLSLPLFFERLAPEGPVDALVEGYKTAYQELRVSHGEQAASPLYDGIRSVLETLNARHDTVLGVATGKSRRGLDHVIATHGLSSVFVTRQDADGHPSKPHPSMALTAMAEAGADIGVMIGDTSFDLEMGRAARLRTVGVAWGYHDVDRLAPLADAIADDPSDLTDLISTLLETTDE